LSQKYITSTNLYLFHEGNLFHSYKMLGAHLCDENGEKGVRFSVWAPNALIVSVVGDFNQWQGQNHQMIKQEKSGIWSLFIPDITVGELYKYEIYDLKMNRFLKSDPYAFYSEYRPNTASIIYSLDNYQWNDRMWQENKSNLASYHQPMHIYEVHFGSWRRHDGNFYTYREITDELIKHVVSMGFTHIEILPLVEHPYDQSWGYQGTGFFSITSRYGTPHDFMNFVDQCHQHGIGVILDWVPSHFAKDAHGLRQFDGTPLFEYADPQKAEKTDWGTLSFDYEKPEVRSFLISNALFLLDVYHIDGLRVDAVSSMLHLDFGKKKGEWTPNKYGSNENLEAIDFLRKLNEVVFKFYPGTLMIAEESTAWPLVSAPTYLGGLGFNYKWNMGWMNDILRYMEMDPIYRKFNHHLLTFSFFYAFSENFILPLSHDEVVHEKKSLLNKMPGDYWQKFANLRVLLGYLQSHPGKKMLFMGAELAQFDEWKDESSLDWNLLDYDFHRKVNEYLKDLNYLYKAEPALWEFDHQQEGFEWIDANNADQSIITFMRKGAKEEDLIIVLCNFTPMHYEDYRIGVPFEGEYMELFNSDATLYGGSGKRNSGKLIYDLKNWHNQKYSLNIQVPPLSIVMFKRVTNKKTGGSLYAEQRNRSNAFSWWRRKTTR